VNFTGAVGGANPTAQTVTVSAQNGVLGQVSLGPITYGAGATDWLTATLSSPSAPANIVLTPSTAALPIGTYTASVPVLGSAATNSPQNIDVTLTVVATLPNSGIVLDIGAAATANVASGANISIPVIVDMTASSGGLRSLTFAFTWDPTLFDYNSSATGTFGTAPNFFVNTAGSATGSINFSVLDNTGLTSTSGSPTIFTVTLTAKNSSAGTNVTANVTAAGDATGQPLPAGVLTVRPLTVTIP
jgi:hypothetical protein